MTVLEKLERMETCAYCMTGDCALGYDAPLNCGYCTEYISIWRENEEVDENVDASNVKIYVPVDELWSFYLQNSDRCKKEMVLIAENTDTGYAVYVTDEDGTLMFSVCKGDESPEYEEYALNAEDCASTAKKMMLRYLIPFSIVNGRTVMPDNLPDGLDDDDGELALSRQDMEDEMYEREDELDLAIKDFLAVVLQEPDSDRLVANYQQSFIDEVLNDFLSILAKDYCCEIFRPMFIEDTETGCELYTQFPYEEDNNDSEGGDKDA